MDLPRGTVTFLFTDVEGNTLLGGEHQDALRRDLIRHERLLIEAATRHAGIPFKVHGDELQIAFERATDAVQAAVEAQRAFLREPWQVGAQFRVRMALHASEVDPRTDFQGQTDYRDPLLNRLGRLRDAAHGGQILLSAAAAELVRQRLPAGVTLRDLGEYALRDVRPEHIFQALHADLPDAFPPPRGASRVAHHLPSLPTALIGRSREAAEIGALLREQGARLVTLTGPGGVGKTRLAIQVASQLSDSFADGVYLVDLASLSDPELVASEIARAIGVREDPERPAVASLIDWLRDHQVLLVLDTFEQVTGAGAMVAELLLRVPGLYVLIASRATLNIQAEYEYPVPPLALPPANAPVEAIVASESVRLFVERARAVQRGFAVTAENAPLIAAICARLDGLPLAIELAAARIKVFPLAALLDRLGLAVLTGGARDRPARQRTLRETIAWSYDLLSPAEQTLFRRLAIFAGGFTFEAAETLIAGLDEEAASPAPAPSGVSRRGRGRAAGPAVLDGLTTLIDNSLLRQVRDEETRGPDRYRMLDTIREFGLDQLEAAGELVTLGDRQADWILDLAERTEPLLRGADRQQGLEALDREQDNIRAALDWIRDQGDAARGLRLAGALWQWWWWRTSLGEGRRWIAELVDLPGVDAYPALQARALTGLGTLVETQGEVAAADRLLERASALWEEVGDRHGLATSYLYRWLVAFDHENYPRMRELATESLETFEEIDDIWGIALSKTELGIGAMREGDLASARQLLEDGRQRFQSVSEPWGIAVASGTLANVLFLQQQIRDGLPLIAESLQLFLQMRDGWGLATFLHSPARLAAALERWEQALVLMSAGDALCNAIGAPLRVPFRQLVDENKTRARSALGDERYERIWSEGQAMTAEEAVARALSPWVMTTS